ncbi:2-hydroxy-3-oxopropionate reductase [Candidatus Albibeggiatoa sp. nov. BB20]|uniref:2-hydroxy-3-oxopropionate reductase n=1 Tax=Candidatus Albibeggiatoa sp. nov. BB20 TaxID=3162723 RepID=UPI003365A47A
MEKIGFVGLGIMGNPMALNLCNAGYSLAVYARRSEMMQPLTAVGAMGCDSPQAVAEQSDIIFTMVSDTSDVEQVILGENGIIHGAKAGSLVIDMSSIAALATRKIAETLGEKGIEMLDAPVSGGDKGAIAGTLSIMVGGKTAQFERAKPLFDVMGGNVVHIGDNGAGQVAKTCNQVLVSQTIAAVAEALILAKAAGVDPANVRQALLGGFAGSKILEIHGQRMLDHDFEPGFKAKLHQKDIKIALQTAHDLGVALPGTALSAQYLNALMGTGQGELDSAAMVLALETLSDVKLK